MEDRSLRHRSHPPRVRGVGHRLPVALPRHVRVRRSGTRAPAQLWLVRDRIGIKPLYYSVHHGRLTFASEIKALLEDPEQRRAVDETALFHYLSFLTTPGPADAVRRHQKAAAGHVASRRRRRHDRPNGATGTSGTMCRRSHGAAKTRSPSASSPSCGPSVQPAQGERRAGRRVSLGRARLEHQRGAVLGRRDVGRSRRSRSATPDAYRTYQNELSYARQMAARVGADHHEYLVTRRRHRRLPAADGAAAGRADRRSGLRAALLRREARARSTASSSASSAKAPTSCSSAIRAGSRRSKRQHWNDLAGAERRPSGSACAGARRARLRPHRARRVAAPRRARTSRCSGAAPRRSPTPRSGACCRRACAGRCGDLTSWDAIRPIRERFERTRPSDRT